jgi:hypothetical protein
MRTRTKEKEKWDKVKGKLIQLFGSLKNAAFKFDCHTSALRKAVEGQCPAVWNKMRAVL